MFRLALILSLAIWKAFSALPDYQFATGTCTSHQALGMTNFCDGVCIDGTSLGDVGQCEFWYDGCLDMNNPSCGPDQVFRLIDREVLHDGTCGNGPDDIQVQYQYSWTCCDCPSGYHPVAQDCEGWSNQGNGAYCLGCKQHDFPKWNENAQTFVCDGPDFRKGACNMAKANQGLLDALSLSNTALGAFCAPGNVIALVIRYAGDAVAAFNAFKDQFSGNPSNKMLQAAIQVTATFASLGIAAAVETGAIDVAPVIGVVWAVGCGVRGAAGIALSAAKIFTNNVLNCPKSRSIDDLESSDLLTNDAGLNKLSSTTHHSRRASYNPCKQLFNLLSNTFNISFTVDQACNQVSGYQSYDTYDAGVSNTSSVLQHFCKDYQYTQANTGSSVDNSTVLMAYSKFLGALYAAIPFCHVSSNGTLEASHRM